MVDVVLAGGRSFVGLGTYLVEGSRGKPRLEHALGDCFYFNLPVVRGPLHAFRIMAATARDADALKRLARIPPGGRAGEKSVYHFVLSLSLQEKVTNEQLRAAVEEALLELGLEDRQAVAIVHVDTGHLHVHVVANRVSPEDGRFANMGRDRIKLSRWAKGWEQRTFGRTFCRRPDRDENLRVDERTYNRPGSYPIRFRNRNRPVRDEHRREAWRSLLKRQRDQVDAVKKSGGDVGALEKEQKIERVKLSRRFCRIEEQGDPKRVDPEEATTVAKSGQEGAPDTADASKALVSEQSAPVDNVSKPARGLPELEATKKTTGRADATRPVPGAEFDHSLTLEGVEGTECKRPTKSGGDGSALGTQQKTEGVEFDPQEAAAGAMSGDDRTRDTTDASKSDAAEKPDFVGSMAEPIQHSPEWDVRTTPSGPAGEIRPVPISKPAHAPAVKCVEATGGKQPNEATEGNGPTPQAVQRRTAQQTSEPAGPTRTSAKAVDRNRPRDRSSGSVDRRHGQESRPASPGVPPQETRRDADTRPSGKLTERFRAKEQQLATDVSLSPKGKSGGAVESMRDRSVEAAGHPTKKKSDGHSSISGAARPSRNDGVGATASPARTERPTPPVTGDETRVAPIVEPARTQAPSAGSVTGSEQTEASLTNAAPVRPVAQRRTPTQAVESGDSRPPQAKSADTVLRDGGVVDGGHSPQSKSVSPKPAATSTEKHNDDDIQPPTVCVKDCGSDPARAVAAVAAVVSLKLVRPRRGRRLRDDTGPPYIIEVPNMPTSDAQHALELVTCAGVAPQLRELDEQRNIAAVAVAQSLADRLGTRKTFDTGYKQLPRRLPPPDSATFRETVRRAVEWFVDRLREFFERPTNERTTAGNHPRRTSVNRASGATTPQTRGDRGDMANAASRTSRRTASRTPPITESGRIPAKATGDDFALGTMGRTGDRQHPSSTSRPTAPPAPSAPTVGTPDHVRPVREVQNPSIGVGRRLENATGGGARTATSRAVDSVQSAQPERSGPAATPVRGSSARSALNKIAPDLARKIEDEYQRRYGENTVVTSGTWNSIREAAGDDEDERITIDVLIERADNAGDSRERERAERELIAHLRDIAVARMQPAKPEPEKQRTWSSRLTSWFGGGGDAPVTTPPAPDPTAELDDACRRYEHELLEIVRNVVREWRERLERPLKRDTEKSPSYRDERWRRGLEPTPDHDHNQQPGRS